MCQGLEIPQKDGAQNWTQAVLPNQAIWWLTGAAMSHCGSWASAPVCTLSCCVVAQHLKA